MKKEELVNILNEECTDAAKVTMFTVYLTKETDPKKLSMMRQLPVAQVQKHLRIGKASGCLSQFDDGKGRHKKTSTLSRMALVTKFRVLYVNKFQKTHPNTANDYTHIKAMARQYSLSKIEDLMDQFFAQKKLPKNCGIAAFSYWVSDQKNL